MNNKWRLFTIFLLLGCGITIWILVGNKMPSIPKDGSVPANLMENDLTNTVSIDINSIETNTIYPPMDRAIERVTKKKFGQFVDQTNSPVQPERFTGYHTGSDWELFADEISQPVTFRSICSGRLLLKEMVDGYGGVVVTSCVVDNQDVTVVYGHLKLDSVSFDVWDQIPAGEIIGRLGDEYSAETDGERKHLHLGIHKGEEINLKGYVDNENLLSDWIDPCLYVCNNK